MYGAPQYSVFISHSRRDKRKDYFARAFASSGVKASFEEYDPKLGNGEPPWTRIVQRIRDSRATFVLISEYLQAHTGNWVSFEVGLTAAYGHPVWIFEPKDLYQGFVVPYATHQVYYDWKSEEQVKILVEILQRGDLEHPIGERSFRCNNCGLSFSQLNAGLYKFSCPACRKWIKQGAY